MPIEITEDWIAKSRFFNDSHLWKAKSLIEVTEDGITIDVKNIHSNWSYRRWNCNLFQWKKHLLKTKSPIEVTEKWIVICFNEEHALKVESTI